MKLIETHYSPSSFKNFGTNCSSFLFYNFVKTFSIQLTMPSKTQITLSDLLVNFPCKYDWLSLCTHFSSEYEKLTSYLGG